MATLKHNFEIGFRDVGKSNKITNRALLGFMEDTAGMHSNLVGYGLNNIKKTGLTWVLLNWKVKVFSRPIYGQNITVETWARNAEKFYTFRDFKVYDESNNIIAIASTKWVLLDASTMSLTKITDELIAQYTPDSTNVFSGEPEISKLIPPKDYSSIFTYKIQRKDIDINDHMHNVSYLDLAYEAIPEDIYLHHKFNEFEIMYKKETKLGETVKCFYSHHDNIHFITIKSEDEKFLHSVVKFTEQID